MGNLLDHAKREFLAMGYAPLEQEQEDGPNKWMQENVLELLKAFAEQGHSGFSASYCINVFTRLAKFEPLAPLTGADDEWRECASGVFQNIRCGHVFKENGNTYDSTGRVFVTPDGNAYTSFESRVPVTFPYTPTIEHVQVPE